MGARWVRRRSWLCAGAVMAALAAASPARADTLNTPPTQQIAINTELSTDCPRGSVLCAGQGFQSMLQFDLSPIPSGAYIRSATLRMEQWDGPISGDAIAYPITQAWDVETTPPETLLALPYAQTPAAPLELDDNWIFDNADVTAHVQQWVDGTRPNYGFMIHDEGTIDRWASLDGPTAELLIDYVVDTAPPSIGLSGPLFDHAGGELTDEQSALSIDAEDPAPSSGMRAVAVSVDGVEELRQEAPGGSASPSLLASYTFYLEAYEDGPHTIAVSATDAAGHTATRSFTVTVVGPSPDEKESSEDDGLAPPDDPPGQTAHCDPDPDADPDDGVYCDGDNDSAAALAFESEPPVGEERTNAFAIAPSLDPGGDGYGMSDNNVNMFSDSRFGALRHDGAGQPIGLPLVRKIVAWDVISVLDDPDHDGKTRYHCVNNHSSTTRTIDVAAAQGRFNQNSQWLAAAHAQGRQILVSFEHTQDKKAYCYLPSASEYLSAVKRFIAMFPYVSAYTAWNEPNHPSQPTSRHYNSAGGARRAGLFWRRLSAACKTRNCAVAAGDFLDDGTFNHDGAGSFWADYVDGMGTSNDGIWAWHAYNAGLKLDRDLRNHNKPKARSTLRLRWFIQATRFAVAGGPTPRIWLTEQGGLFMRHRTDDMDPDPLAQQHQADDLQFLLGLPALSDRITRYYNYQWIGTGPAPGGTYTGQFDAGLLTTPDGAATRLAYGVYRARTCPGCP